MMGKSIVDLNVTFSEVLAHFLISKLAMTLNNNNLASINA